MKTTLSASNRPRLGTLDDFLAPEDIVPLPVLADDEWNTIRRVAGGQLAWRFCTLRNLWVHRGRFASDAFGFAWGGIYRTLLVGSIVATSYRNEGLFRAGERIQGTNDFFRSGFVMPRSSAEFREIARLVNLRHHVAGVVAPHADETVGEMYVVPSATAPVVVVIDAKRFEVLKQEPGFRAATAAEVQRRLSLNTALTGTQLEDAAARSGDARLASIAQLFRYLTGDSHVALDAVIDLPDEATPAECIEALRRQVDGAIAAGGLAPDLVRYLQQVVTTIG